MDENKTVSVGIGEIYATNDMRMVLAAYGLGSCVGVSLYDPVARSGGIAHVLLPNSKEASYGVQGLKFADHAIPALITEVTKHGAMPKRLICKIAGGAQMLIAPGLLDGFRIGERNVEAVKEALKQNGLAPRAIDTGGCKGRTLRLYIATGQVLVKTVGQSDVEL